MTQNYVPTQNALLRLIQSWTKVRNYLGLFGTILIDLSKTYNSLPIDLLITKNGAYGLNKPSLSLVKGYFH